MRAENRIDYVEIPVTNMKKARSFFEAMFGWEFQEWGDEYLSFNDGRLAGGMRLSSEPAPTTGVLLVFFSEDLERDLERVKKLDGTISQEIFSFPGGRRFHFIDPVGNEFAIWGESTEITKFVCYEALKNIKTKEVTVKTPVGDATCRQIDTDIVVVPILRAGVGMLEGILELVPTARVGFVGLYRDEETKQPVTYYERFPRQIKGGTCIVIDPMLATGGSTVAALDLLKESGAEDIVVICIVTCPEGIALVEEAHPDVKIYAAAIDEKLDEKKYIVPGLGDAGDRLFGTSHH
jgi:uracil phosphoribosyltransferase